MRRLGQCRSRSGKQGWLGRHILRAGHFPKVGGGGFCWLLSVSWCFPCWRPPQRGLVGMRPRPGISGGCKGLFASRGMPAGQGKEPLGGAAPGRSFPRSRPLAATGGNACQDRQADSTVPPAGSGLSIMGIMLPRASCGLTPAHARKHIPAF